MQTLSFIKQDPTTLPSADEQTGQLAHRREKLDRLEFHGVRRWETQGADQLFTATTLFPELKGRTFKLWKQFLPTTVRDFRNYRFDSPPDEALDAIQTAKDLGCFDRIEIWTPEGNSFLGLVARKVGAAQDKLAELGSRIDPMAVGVVTDRNGKEQFFQIVRWGESLKDIKAIKRHVASVNWRARLLFILLPLLGLFTGMTAWYQGVEHFGYGAMLFYSLIAIMVLCLVAMMGAIATDA